MARRKPKAEKDQAAELAATPAELEGPRWTPRPYQQAALDAFHGRDVAPWSGYATYQGRRIEVGSNGWSSSRGPCRRMLLIWHRRAGKDRFGLEVIRDEADLHVGGYWHLYPLKVQAKTAIWHGVDPQTKRGLMEQVFPPAWRAHTGEQDMLIRSRQGSTYQLQGSDYYNRLVGSNVLGALFSEWALCDPNAWPYVMPILVENGGWAMFITTFRGRNHAYQMATKLMASSEWYVDIRTIEHTTREDGSRVVLPEDVQREREALTALHGTAARADAQILEEFYCDPMAAAPGSVYGKLMAQMLAEGRA